MVGQFDRDALDPLQNAKGTSAEQASDDLGTPVHTEQVFESEEPMLAEGLRGTDDDGYVGLDGKMAPHQSPSEVEEERLAAIERAARQKFT